MGSSKIKSVPINMINFQNQFNLAYVCFLKGVLALLKTFPAYTRIIIATAKAMLDLVPAVICGVMSLAVLFAQEYNSKCRAVKDKTEEAEKGKTELSRLENAIEVEKEERIRLRESSDVVVECIKALQRKLNNETQLRESFVQNSQLEKAAQNKKIDNLISRLNLLRGDLRRSLLGMDNALNGEDTCPESGAPDEQAGGDS